MHAADARITNQPKAEVHTFSYCFLRFKVLVFTLLSVQILGELVSRMSPTISRLLSECLTGVLPHQRPSYHRLLHFLDVNIIFLKEWLAEDNFERALSVIW